jgi:Ca2+-binding RTX toxin-like protein
VLCDVGSFDEVGFFVGLRNGNDSASFSEPGDEFLFLVVEARGGPGNDQIEGANDQIGDFSSENFLFGGSGNDRLTGGIGGTVLDGGGGNDQLLTGDGGASVLRGGGGNDQLLGGTGEELAFGGPGNDSISGGRFLDSLEGGPGDDSISGGRGRDFLEGGPGDDSISGGFGPDLVEARGDVNFRLTPTALIGAGSDTLSGIERARVVGGPGNNVIDARSWRRPTVLAGGGGNDFILGGFGRDRIRGGLGNDRIGGRAERDLLSGGPGADVLFSRDQRRDQVYGGRGWDRASVDSLDVTRLIEVFFS